MYVAVMGYGTVGSGVAALLRKNHELIRKKSRQESLELRHPNKLWLSLPG